jgi:glycosyltransferase involved in cell wall biosynthesis
VLRTVLYVSHTHPTVRRGGLQVYADELYRAVRDAGDWNAVFVAKVGPPHSRSMVREGTRFSLVDTDPGVYYFHTDVDEFDTLLRTAKRKRLYVDDWREFLEVNRPDVVHFHASDWLGYDMLRETRRTLPEAAIVYTLHEYAAICHLNGEMVRRKRDELCDEAAPHRCHECLPKIPAASFFLRERFIKSAFELVDMFIAPTKELRRRYVEWGLPPDKIRYEENGRLPVTPLPDPLEAGHHRRVAYFGQLAPNRGVDILLEAVKLLQREQLGVELSLHAANLELQREPFQNRIRALLEETRDSVRFAGQYQQAQLPALFAATDWVVVPSTWWEASPLVIQEAKMYRRPVICSGIGAMAETVSHDVDGLHFEVGDPASLAAVIRRAVSRPKLWARLRDGIEGPRSMDAHVATISAIYSNLLDARRPQPAAA